MVDTSGVRRGNVIQIRVSDAEKELLAQKARANGMVLSEWLRSLGLSSAGGGGPRPEGGARFDSGHGKGGSTPPRQRQKRKGSGDQFGSGQESKPALAPEGVDVRSNAESPEEPPVQREGEEWGEFMYRRKTWMQEHSK